MSASEGSAAVPWSRVWTVVMAGGVGSRFWPLSRAARPKQLLDLFGEGTMLRTTMERLSDRVPMSRQVIVSGRLLGPEIRAQLPELAEQNLLEEPVGRNTAAAIGWAALSILRRDPDALLAVLPADHHVVDVAGFQAACGTAIAEAACDRIVTLGIRPTRPETGYGYILAGPERTADVYEADAFKEKPDLDTALQYLAHGGYLWNAGMFFMPAQLAVDELTKFEPELMAGLAQLDVEGGASSAQLDAVYPGLPSTSIDYAVMERSSRVSVVPGDFGWSDLGSWRTLWDFRVPGEGSFELGNVVEIDGDGNVLCAEEGTVATVGVSDLIVVHTRDATLVCPRESAQRVRELVDRLKHDERKELL
jgi:mannose-1-phosphate guanylyltransferase